MDLDPIC